MTVGELIDAFDVKKGIEVKLGPYGALFEIGSQQNADWSRIRTLPVAKLSKRIGTTLATVSWLSCQFPDAREHLERVDDAVLTIIAEA